MAAQAKLISFIQRTFREHLLCAREHLLCARGLCQVLRMQNKSKVSALTGLIYMLVG